VANDVPANGHNEGIIVADPNPFNGATTISIDLRDPSPLAVSIHDVTDVS